MEILKSAGLFFGGILRRFWLWLPALVFDPFDVYERIIKPQLPEESQVDIAFPSQTALLALGGLIIWAAILTYHELRQKLPRTGHPNIRIKNAIDYLVNESTLLPIFRKPPTTDDGKEIIGIEHDLARTKLAERIYSGVLQCWGRIEKGPGGRLFGPKTYDFDFVEIPQTYWDSARLHMLTVLTRTTRRPQTEPLEEDIIRSSQIRTYTDLHLSKEQLMTLCPKKSLIRRCYEWVLRKSPIIYPPEKNDGARQTS